MTRRFARTGIVVFATFLAVSLVTGCASAAQPGTSQSSTGAKSGSGNHSPAPEATVYSPTPPSAADTTLLDTQCNMTGQPTWQSNYSGPVSYLIATLTAKLRKGTPTWNTNADVAFALAIGSSAYSGAYQVEQSDCAPGRIVVPGSIHGVLPVLASDPAHSTFGWATGGSLYGFDGDGNDPSDPNGGGDTIVSNCAVQLSAVATTAVPGIVAWKTQPFVQTVGCYYTMP